MREHDDLGAGLEAVQRDLVGVQQRLHLARHGVEHACRRGALRDERGDPPQRGLLLRQPLRPGVRLGVGDRGRHEVGELHEPGLGVRGEHLVLGPDAHRAPEAALDPDRHGEDGAQVQRSSPFADRAARRRVVVVHSRRLSGAEDARDRVLALERLARAHRELRRRRLRARHHHLARAVLEAHQADVLGAELPLALGPDRLEDLGLGSLARDHRRHPPQRGLLAGTHLQLSAARLGGPPRVAELGVDPPALRHVAPDGVDHVLLRHVAGAPLQPALGSVGADPAGLELAHDVAAEDVAEPRHRGLPLLGMDEVEERPPEQRLRRVADRPLERRVHGLEAPVGVDDADHVQRQLEDPLDLALRAPALRDRAPDRERDAGHRERPGERQPREHRLQAGLRLAGHVDAPVAAEHLEARARLDGVELPLDPLPVLDDREVARVAAERGDEPTARDERDQVAAVLAPLREGGGLEQVEAGLLSERPRAGRADGEDARPVPDRGRQRREARHVHAGTQLRSVAARVRGGQVRARGRRADEAAGLREPGDADPVLALVAATIGRGHPLDPQHIVEPDAGGRGAGPAGEPRLPRLRLLRQDRRQAVHVGPRAPQHLLGVHRFDAGAPLCRLVAVAADRGGRQEVSAHAKDHDQGEDEGARRSQGADPRRRRCTVHRALRYLPAAAWSPVSR